MSLGVSVLAGKVACSAVHEVAEELPSRRHFEAWNALPQGKEALSQETS